MSDPALGGAGPDGGDDDGSAAEDTDALVDDLPERIIVVREPLDDDPAAAEAVPEAPAIDLDEVDLRTSAGPPVLDLDDAALLPGPEVAGPALEPPHAVVDDADADAAPPPEPDEPDVVVVDEDRVLPSELDEPEGDLVDESRPSELDKPENDLVDAYDSPGSSLDDTPDDLVGGHDAPTFEAEAEPDVDEPELDEGPPTEAFRWAPDDDDEDGRTALVVPERDEAGPSTLRPTVPEPALVAKKQKEHAAPRTRSRRTLQRMRALLGLVFVVVLSGVGLAAAIGGAVLLIVLVLSRAFGSGS